MNNKIVKTKKISAIFLATVLIAGTIALSYPSFMTIEANAQAQQYFGMDSRYNSYEPEYPDKKHDSYGASDYRMDKKPYGMDDSYEPEYPSYKPDYKLQYPSYYKDDKRDKSTKDSSSVDIKKIKCINSNLNINGENAGDVNVGNKGQGDAADEQGYLGGYSSDGYSERYYDGYDNKGFECIINNNNNNTNVAAGGGNVTDGDAIDECEECFAQVLNATDLGRLQVALGNGINVNIGTTSVEINSLEELCTILENLTGAQVVSVVSQILSTVGIFLPTTGEFFDLVTCIGTALGITIPPPD